MEFVDYSARTAVYKYGNAIMAVGLHTIMVPHHIAGQDDAQVA